VHVGWWGKAVGTAMRWRPLFEGQHTVGRHYSDSEADQWAPHVLTFFQILENQVELVNSKWTPFLAPKILKILHEVMLEHSEQLSQL
jgi:hypothetical protein